MKNAFNNAVSTLRDGINHAPGWWCHSIVVLAALSAGAYGYTDGHPVAGLATTYFIFSSLSNYYYEGRLYREKQAPRP